MYECELVTSLSMHSRTDALAWSSSHQQPTFAVACADSSLSVGTLSTHDHDDDDSLQLHSLTSSSTASLVNSLAFSSCGSQFLSVACEDTRRLCVYDVTTASLAIDKDLGGECPMRVCAHPSDPHVLVLFTDKGRVAYHDLRQLAPTRVIITSSRITDGDVMFTDTNEVTDMITVRLNFSSFFHS